MEIIAIFSDHASIYCCKVWHFLWESVLQMCSVFGMPLVVVVLEGLQIDQIRAYKK